MATPTLAEIQIPDTVIAATWSQVVALLVANRDKLGIAPIESDDAVREASPLLYPELVKHVVAAQREGDQATLDHFAWFVKGMAAIAEGPAGPADQVH